MALFILNDLPIKRGQVLWDRRGAAHYFHSWDGVGPCVLVRSFSTSRTGGLRSIDQADLSRRPWPRPPRSTPQPRPGLLAAPGERLSCGGCNRSLHAAMRLHGAYARETGAVVILGPECWREVRAAGEMGWTTPVRMRLWVGPVRCGESRWLTAAKGALALQTIPMFSCCV